MSIFKAYDVRGTYPDQINEEVVAKIAKGLAAHWSKSQTCLPDRQVANRPASMSRGEAGKSQQITIVVGHDARLSSPALYRVVVNTLHPTPYTLIEAGIITTPMLYFLVNHYHAVGGVMVTASHNPKEYNGLKVVGEGAIPISGTELRGLTESL